MNHFKLLTKVLSATIFLLLLPCFVLSSTTGIIKGKVMNVSSRKPVSGAKVVVEGTGLSAFTGENGGFEISTVPAGEYYVKISAIDYLTVTNKVTVISDKIVTINFNLKKIGRHQEQIVVTATKTKHMLKDTPVLTSVITKEEIETANIQSVQHALRYLSGIQINESYGWGDKGKVEIMGLDDKHTLVLLDGQRVFGGHGNSVDLQAYPIDQVERIEVVKGPGSALYGSDAMGGVVNIITKSTVENEGRFNISPSFGTRERQTFKLTHGLSTGDFNYVVGYTHNQTDGIDPEVDKYEEDIIFGSFRYRFSPDLNLTLKPYYSIQTMEESDRKQERYSLATVLEWNPDVVSSFNVRASLFSFNHRWTENEERTGYRDDLYEVELTYNRFMWNSHSVTLGYHYQGMDLDNEHICLVAEQNIHSLYAQDEMFYKPLTFVLGARIDNHELWGTEINPKASVMAELTDDLKIRGSIGRAFRGPSLTKLYGSGWRMGPFIVHDNPNLEPETSIGYHLSAEWNISSMIMVNAVWFLNEIDNLIEAQYTKRGRPPWSMEWRNIAEARTQGVEINISCHLMNTLSARLGYTHLITENIETGYELPYKAKDSLNFRLDWKFPNIGLGLVLDGRYIGKRYWDDENTEVLGDYTLVNISISEEITRYLTVFLRLDNILGVKDIKDSYFINGIEVLAGFKVSL